MSLFGKIRERGVLHTIEIAFNRLVPAWVFRFSTGQVFELDPQKLMETFTELDNADFVMTCVEQDSAVRDQLRSLTWNSVPIETSANDFGYSIASVSDPSNVLGGVWAGIGSFQEADLGFQLQFDTQQSWIYCAYVKPEAQGRGVYKRVLAFSAKDLIEKDYQRIYVIIQPWNKASTYIHSKYAKAKVGTISAFRVFSFCAVFSTGVVEKDRTLTRSPLANPVQLHIRD
jgi:ribosomal protein S18 acetylase RimI-like enzyme